MSIIKCTGPLTYEVNLNDQTQQLHVDHIKPWAAANDSSENTSTDNNNSDRSSHQDTQLSPQRS